MKQRKRGKGQRYSVEASFHNVALTRAGSSVNLEIFERDKKIVELQVGRGLIFWWGAKSQKRKRLRWVRVAEEMNRLAYGDEQPE